MAHSEKIEAQPVILCGGSGTRLWPLSRSGFPKQFLCLTGNESLFQQTARRLAALEAPGFHLSAPLIVSNDEHRFLALEQLREINIEASAFLLEPMGKNTAPALTLAALKAIEEGQDPVLIVTPADHAVSDAQAFSQAIQQSIHEAAQGNIVVLGIVPDKPETGYGYIKATSHKPGAASNSTIVVEGFIEKPDSLRAQEYLKEGNYFWNAGLFVLKASIWLAALKLFRPDIATACEIAWQGRTHDTTFIRPNKSDFSNVPGESIDYAVMEHCPNSSFTTLMIPLNAGWNDLGAWDAVWNSSSKDNTGNAHVGDVVAKDCENTLVHATSRLVSLVGIKDMVVIETPDVVLVVDKSHCQDVKHVVNLLSEQKRAEHVSHRKVYRPWGWYDSVDEGDRFKVKRIQVKPKASLSLQKHHHRAEHWVVVTGTAEVTNGEKIVLLTENQSTYIPLGETHRLSNPGNIPLEIIEVQSGSYLGEDDIVRFEDKYGRKDS